MKCACRIFILIGLLIGFCLPTLSAQTYHIYRPVSQKQVAEPDVAPRNHYIEIQAASVFSAGTMRDTKDNVISRGMYGWRGRILTRITDIVSVGVEGQTLKSHDMKTNRISPFKRTEWDVLAKITLTPSTSPRLYALLGIGQSKQRTKFDLRPEELKRSSMLLTGGAGIEVNVWKGLVVSGEYMLHYDSQRWDNFVLTAPRMRHDFSVGVSYLF